MQNKNRKISEFDKLKKTGKTEIFTKITKTFDLTVT